MNKAQIRRFLDEHPGLVWSSELPSFHALVSAVLRSAQLDAILDLSRIVTPEVLMKKWERLTPQGTPQTAAQHQTSLILSGIYEVSQEASPEHAIAA
jgi:hypothetical protein